MVLRVRCCRHHFYSASLTLISSSFPYNSFFSCRKTYEMLTLAANWLRLFLFTSPLPLRDALRHHLVFTRLNVLQNVSTHRANTTRPRYISIYLTNGRRHCNIKCAFRTLTLYLYLSVSAVYILIIVILFN